MRLFLRVPLAAALPDVLPPLGAVGDAELEAPQADVPREPVAVLLRRVGPRNASRIFLGHGLRRKQKGPGRPGVPAAARPSRFSVGDATLRRAPLYGRRRCRPMPVILPVLTPRGQAKKP